MDTIICDISALKFWRTPPVIRLLASGQLEGTSLEHIIPEERLATFQNDLVASSPLCQMFVSGSRWRRLGSQAHALRDIFMLLAPCLDAPIDVLTQKRGGWSSDFLRPRLWSAELPPGSVVQISDDVGVASPAFALLQVVARSSWTTGLMMASELCGSYSVYRAPSTVKSFIDYILSQNAGLSSLCKQNDWRPCLSDGGLTSLWSRPALIEPHDLMAIGQSSESPRGKSRLIEVAELVKPGAASPLETQTGMLLGLSPRRGGMGLADYRYNERIHLSPNAKALCQKNSCVCDLFYEDAGLDIECQSSLVHDNETSYISDFERSAALAEMGIEVLFASSDILSSPKRFKAFATLVADRLSASIPSQTNSILKAQTNLRANLFCDWARLI